MKIQNPTESKPTMQISSTSAQNVASTKPLIEIVPLWQVVLLAALAGGMGWGIEGQYGHETGAMIPGLLVALVLMLLLCPSATSLQAARAVALCAAAMGFGGAMTYGQTLGLTHNPEMVGNWAALRWGMLGLGIKGTLWVGFAGAFLGMGLSGVRYHPRELAMMLGGLLLLMLLGMWALNQPFDPAHRSLPRIYFSADWSWYPTSGEELEPRREVWGGFLFALAGLVLYLGWFRKDLLARNMAFWGCLGGLGFPIGQSLQVWHGWNRDLFREGFLADLDKVINWWNFMETTFGLVMGAALGLGLWLNRRRIAALDRTDEVSMKPAVEFGLLTVHLPLLFLWEFAALGPLDAVGDLGIPLSFIPLIGIAGGRHWPYLMALPVVAFPILAKTGEAMGFPPSTSVIGAGLFVALPFVLLMLLAMHFSRSAFVRPETCARDYLSPTLLIVTWLYFALNYAFFKFPWPWQTWTARTPNAMIFMICALALTSAALKFRRSDRRY
jgi:hypothetical protein